MEISYEEFEQALLRTMNNTRVATEQKIAKQVQLELLGIADIIELTRDERTKKQLQRRLDNLNKIFENYL